MSEIAYNVNYLAQMPTELGLCRTAMPMLRESRIVNPDLLTKSITVGKKLHQSAHRVHYVVALSSGETFPDRTLYLRN